MLFYGINFIDPIVLHVENDYLLRYASQVFLLLVEEFNKDWSFPGLISLIPLCSMLRMFTCFAKLHRFFLLLLQKHSSELDAYVESIKTLSVCAQGQYSSVIPTGFEPISPEPESGILSIELRDLKNVEY